MLAHTSHLPLASHRLSVPVTQRAVISSDIVGQEKKKRRGNNRGKVFQALCVLGDDVYKTSLVYSAFFPGGPLLSLIRTLCVTSSYTLSFCLKCHPIFQIEWAARKQRRHSKL